MSREHPLLMRPELVVATLAGRKWQTRRLVTPATSTVDGFVAARIWPTLIMDRAGPGWVGTWPVLVVPTTEGRVVHVHPRVRPGERVYIRETWQTGAALDDEAPAMLAAWAKAGGVEPCGPVRYVADGASRDEHLLAPGSHYGEHWGRRRPGIHMPRWASRLVLPVASVRVERVQSISEDDARAEGVEPFKAIGPDQHLCEPGDTRTQATHPHVIRFASLWDAINGDRPGASWSANPWTWIYEWLPVGGQPGASTP